MLRVTLTAMDNQDFILLITKELSGEIATSEQAQLQLLLEQPELQRQYTALKAFWEEEQSLSYQEVDKAFKKVSSHIQVLEQQSMPATIDKRRIGMLRYAAVAAILLLLAGSYWAYNSFDKAGNALAHGKWQEKYTPKKVRSEMTLSDGTHIVLNADSKLQYPEKFDGTSREVFLTGEAYFDVAKDAKHPFIIHTSKMDIRVLGTAFNVRNYPDETTSEATLLQGAIEINVADRPADKIYLKPNDKFVLTNTVVAGKANSSDNEPAAHISSYAVAALTHYESGDSSDIVETSWMNNRLVFRSETFGSLAKKMERWYGVNIDFQNPQQQDLRFTGVFEKESLEQALHALQLTEQFRYTLTGESLHIQ